MEDGVEGKFKISSRMFDMINSRSPCGITKSLSTTWKSQKLWVTGHYMEFFFIA